MSDVHNFRTEDGCLVQTAPAPEYLGGEGHMILTLAMTGKHDARRVSVHLRPDEVDQVSDGYHTFGELYRFRRNYHAAFVNEMHKRYAEFVDATYPGPTVKSWKHSDGDPCFGGGWFIVVTQLPTGQISNHYPAADWDLFRVPEVEEAPLFDGHTPGDVLERLEEYLRHG